MKSLIYFLTMILLFSCKKERTSFGKAILLDSPFYIENVYDSLYAYFPYDKSLKSDLNDKPVIIERLENNEIKITNVSNNGFTGNKIQIIINSELDILDVNYEYWDDVIDGSTSKYTIEKIILTLDKNFIKENNYKGYYTIQIKSNYAAGEISSSEGVNDTIMRFLHHGKFRVQ
jgi:hypothetical protein